MDKKADKIRVLMPVLHYPPVIGGFEVFIKAIAERLGQELPVLVVTGRVKGVLNSEILANLRIIRTSLFNLKDFSYSSRAYILSALVFVFFKSWYLIKKEKITILHCHGFFSGLIGWALKVITGIPYVMTIQSADLDIYHPQSPQWLIDFIHYLEKKVYGSALVCHSVSHDLQNYFLKQGVKESIVISNGVDGSLFKPVSSEEKNTLRQALGFSEREKIIVSVSRLEKKNGTEDLIKSLKGLQFSDYQLLIIGDGTERKYLEQLTAGLALSDKVRFLGPVSHSGLPKYLQIADLFVRAPLAEGFGIVYIEAMACGLPVIGAPVGGIKDIIIDTKTGLFAQPNNPPDLANKINYFFLSRVGNILQENGLRLVADKYDWDKIVEEIRKLYVLPFRLAIAAGIYPPDIGGPATYARRLFSELPKQGIMVKAIAYGDSASSDGVIKISRKKNLFFRYLAYFWQLRKLANPPAGGDLIYAQCLLSSGLPTWLASKITGKPYFIKVTGDYAWEQAQNRFGIRDLLGDFQKKKYGWRIELMRWLQKLAVRQAKKVIVPSQYLKKIVLGWGIKENKIKVIYNSFESEVVGNKNFCSLPRENFILSAGRLEPWKGFDVLIKLMPGLPADLKLAIAGDGPEEDNLKKQIADLGLADRVKLLGRVPHQELKNYYQRAKMFVLNTAYEGLSHILLEAMANGLPIITTNVGGNPEVVSDLLVEYNNQEEIKEAILKIYNNPDLAGRLVQQGYEKLKDFSFEKMIGETVKVLTGEEEKVVVLLQINYSQDHSEVTLPLGTLSVGSALNKAGFKVKLMNITEKQIRSAVEEIIGLQPLFLGLSVMTGVQTRYSAELCKKLKEKCPVVRIVWGGIHPSLLPEQCLGEDYIDFAVIGEGEITAVELAGKLIKSEAGESAKPENDFSSVLGLGWKKDGQKIINPVRPFIANLDEYRLNFGLVDLNKYLFRLRGAQRAIAYKASRGCPFNCAFCYNRAFNQSRCRYWSIDAVIDDIDYLKKNHRIDAVKFYDDNFFIDQNRAFELLAKIDLPSHIEIRIDMITDEVAKRLKELKVSELLIGIESGSNRMLKLINKGYNVERIKAGVLALAKHDLYVTYSTIVGLPTETEEEFNQTLELMSWIHQVHPRSGFTLGAYLPYPGSMMYQFAIDQGFKPPVKTIGWGDIDRFRKDFSSPWVDSRKVWRIREYFKFFSYNLSMLNRWSEYRLKHRFFGWPIDIYLIEFLAGIAIEEKGLVGRLLRKIHNSIKRFK